MQARHHLRPTQPLNKFVHRDLDQSHTRQFRARQLLISVTFALVCICLQPASSSAFTLTQDNLKGFPYKELRVSLNPTNCMDDVEEDLEFAMELWNNVAGSRLRLIKESPNDVDPSDFTSYSFLQMIVIGCSTTFAADTGGGSLNIIGIGSSSTMNAHYLKKGFVILNEEGGAGQYSTHSKAVRRFTMAHELGHVLGLGHSSVLESLMYPSVATKSDTNLHQDDLDGIIYLYPIDEIEDEMLYGCGTISKANNKFTPTNLMMSLFFLFLPLLLFAFLQRKSKLLSAQLRP
jgi:hypothetical protein